MQTMRMKSPTTKDLEELKRVACYLRGPVGANVVEPQTLAEIVQVFCDADHAGDLGTRMFRFETTVMWESHFDQSWRHGAKHHIIWQWRVLNNVAQPWGSKHC